METPGPPTAASSAMASHTFRCFPRSLRSHHFSLMVKCVRWLSAVSPPSSFTSQLRRTFSGNCTVAVNRLVIWAQSLAAAGWISARERQKIAVPPSVYGQFRQPTLVGLIQTVAPVIIMQDEERSLAL